MLKITKSNIEDILPLTPLQEGLLFHFLKDPAGDNYFDQLFLNLTGDIDSHLFEKSWHFVVKANEMLRVVFRWEKMAQPVQMILKDHPPGIRFHDLSRIHSSDREKQIEQIAANDKKEKFALQDVPFRLTLVKKAESHYLLIITNHHMIYDGWSSGIIIDEFFSTYNDLYAKKKLPILQKHCFKDFLSYIQNQDRVKQEKYWQDYLSGFDMVMDIPIKEIKNNQKGGHEKSNYSIGLAKDFQDEAAHFIKNHRLTFALLFYSAWGIVLQTYHDSSDIIFGTTVSGRDIQFEGIEKMVGPFINTLPLRVQAHPGQTLLDFVSNLNRQVNSREKYSHSSLVDIKKFAGLDHAAELFESIVVIENYPIAKNLLQESENENLWISSFTMDQTNSYMLTLRVLLLDDIGIDFVYDTNLFTASTIEKLAQRFQHIVHLIVSNPGQRLHDIEIITAEEKQQLLVYFNDTGAEFPGDKTIHQLFEEQAAQTPDAIAVFSHGQTLSWTNNNVGAGPRVCPNSLTYRQLNKQSNHMAGLLIEKGVLPEHIVAIIVEPSVEMISGIMGILKSGGAYLPIEPGSPPERIDYLLKESGAKLLAVANYKNQEGEKVRRWEGELNGRPRRGLSNFGFRISDLNSSNLAYVISTSGTTGKPKGVLVTHRNLVNYVAWFSKHAGLKPGDNTALLSSAAFDLGYTALFPALLSGVTLHIVEKNTYLTPGVLGNYLLKHRIHYIKITPSLFSTIIDAPGFSAEMFKYLRLIVLGGEEINVNDVERVYDICKNNITVMNHYGPAETTIGAVSQVIECDKFALFKANPTIGKPIANAQVYILDRNLKLMPAEVPGELYISGAGVGRGYLNHPELTYERFTRGSFEKPPLDPTKLLFNYLPLTNHHSPIYKTGDRARWMPDGNIQFLGRVDDQIKIRGYRIELSEIQKQLLEYEAITDAVVMVRHSPNDPRDKFLCAYIVPVDGVNIPGLKQFLSGKLPGYMIPAYFIPIEKIPLTPNGKLDKKSLPLPNIKAGDNYVAPENDLEKKLATIWANVLGINDEIIGIDANFFELGGHSLKATSLIALIHREFNVKIPVTDIFKYPTIRELANLLHKAPGETFNAIEPVEKKEYYELSPAQERFYVIQQTNIENTAYNMPGFFILNQNPGQKKLAQVFDSLLARHESLRTSFEIVNEHPVQKIVHSQPCRLEYKEYNEEYNEETGKNREEIEALIRSFIRPFDLAKAPLFRVGLAELAEGQYLLMIDMHHIISDVISLAILIDDFISLYQEKHLPSLKVQYKDYSGWVRREQDGEPMAGPERYWLNQFAGDIPVLDLPTDYPRGPEKTFAGDTIHFHLPPGLDRELMKMALTEGVSMFMLVLALFNILLSKLSGREEIIVGTLMAGRRHKDLDQVIGLFTNTIALKNDAAGNKTFKEFLAGVRQNTLEAYENQDYPFMNLVNKLPISKNKNRNPLFDVLFFLDNLFQRSTGKMADEMPGLNIKPYAYKRDIAKMDLTLTGVEMEDRLSFRIEYSTQLFKQETIERFIDYFKDIVQQVCADNAANAANHIRLGDIHIAHGLLTAESVSVEDNDEGFRF